MSNPHLALQFFLQLAVILVVCRLVIAVAARLRQPEVVAEMFAGVLLGPSVFGLLWPDAQQWLFPWDGTQQTRDTQSYLYPVAQMGLALYMFVIGMEFQTETLRRHLKSSLAVALAGIFVPLAFGAGLGWALYQHTDLFPKSIPLAVAMLFLGAALGITALPVLARIIQFKKLTGTAVGTISLAAGSVNDAAAWCLLAIVLASLDDSWSHALMNIGEGALYVAVTLTVVRPLLHRTRKWLVKDGHLSEAGLVLGLALMAIGAWFTDLIGLHAVFGAFIMGAAMPRGVVTRDLINRIQPITVALLLPLFSVYSGLNTKITLLNSAYLWLICAGVLVAAVLCKGWACWLAARASRLPNREALAIGALMNARGFMVLIIINIGLQRGIISEGLFATLVIMALVTTVMASPIIDVLMGKNWPVSGPATQANSPFESSTHPVKDAQPLI